MHDEVVAWYAGAVAELDAAVAEPSGVPGGLYDNALLSTAAVTCSSTGRRPILLVPAGFGR